MRRTGQGFTLTELLLAMSILAVMLSVLGAFLSSQTRLAGLTTARANVQDKVRYITAAATQDLQLAGSSRYISSTDVVSTLPSFGACTSSACLIGVDNGLLDTMTARYITSLREKEKACRQVSWTSTAGLLQRSDVECGQAVAPQEFAAGVLAFNIRYVCSDGFGRDIPDCAKDGLFTRSARVTVYASSDQRVEQSSIAPFTVEGTTVNCPAKYACFGIQQEIEMPNMKDK